VSIGSIPSMALKISVIGTGYLGATHAACMASLGFEVIGVDVDPTKVATLSRGEIPSTNQASIPCSLSK